MKHLKRGALFVLAIAMAAMAGASGLDGQGACREQVSQQASPAPEELPRGETRHYDIALAPELQEYTFTLCRAEDLDHRFVLAVMGRESDYREGAISATGDYGLMQINRINHARLRDELGIEDFLDPQESIRAGVHMLAELTAKYEDPHKVLMAYKYGETGAGRLWSQGITTSEYSRSIMARAAAFRKEGLR